MLRQLVSARGPLRFDVCRAAAAVSMPSEAARVLRLPHASARRWSPYSSSSSSPPTTGSGRSRGGDNKRATSASVPAAATEEERGEAEKGRDAAEDDAAAAAAAAKEAARGELRALLAAQAEAERRATKETTAAAAAVAEAAAAAAAEAKAEAEAAASAAAAAADADADADNDDDGGGGGEVHGEATEEPAAAAAEPASVYYSCESMKPTVQRHLDLIRNTAVAVGATAVGSIGTCVYALHEVPPAFAACGVLCTLAAHHSWRRAKHSIGHSILSRHVVAMGGLGGQHLLVEVESLKHGRISHHLQLGAQAQAPTGVSGLVGGGAAAAGVGVPQVPGPMPTAMATAAATANAGDDDDGGNGDAYPTAWPVSRLFELDHFSVVLPGRPGVEDDDLQGVAHNRRALDAALECDRCIAVERTLIEGKLSDSTYVKSFNVGADVTPFGKAEEESRTVSNQVSFVNIGWCALLAVGAGVLATAS